MTGASRGRTPKTENYRETNKQQMETISLKLSSTFCLLQTLLWFVSGQCAPKVVRHKEDKPPSRTPRDLETKSEGQEEALRVSPGIGASPQSGSAGPLSTHKGQEYRPSSQEHPYFSTPEQGAGRPSPSGTASICHCSALTSVLPGDPRYGSKRHRRPKHHGEGDEQPPNRGTHPHRSGLQRELQQQMLAGSGAHSGRHGGVVAAQSRSAARNWWAARARRPCISQRSLWVRSAALTSANVKGHLVLKQRAALQPSEEILEESAKERMQVRMCGNNACFLFSQHHPRPRPWLRFHDSLSHGLFCGGREWGDIRGLLRGTAPHRHCTPEATIGSGLPAPQTGLERRTDRDPTGGTNTRMAAQPLPCVGPVCSW